MIMNLNVGTKNPNIILGNRHDHCIVCAREKAIAENIPVAEAAEDLHGHLEGKYVYRVPVNGQRLIICKEHIKQILDDIEEMG